VALERSKSDRPPVIVNAEFTRLSLRLLHGRRVQPLPPLLEAWKLEAEAAIPQSTEEPVENLTPEMPVGVAESKASLHSPGAAPTGDTRQTPEDISYRIRASALKKPLNYTLPAGETVAALIERVKMDLYKALGDVELIKLTYRGNLVIELLDELSEVPIVSKVPTKSVINATLGAPGAGNIDLQSSPSAIAMDKSVSTAATAGATPLSQQSMCTPVTLKDLDKQKSVNGGTDQLLGNDVQDCCKELAQMAETLPADQQRLFLRHLLNTASEFHNELLSKSQKSIKMAVLQKELHS